MRFEREATPVRVNECVALAPADVLAGVITAWPAGLSGLDALAVDDRGRGAGVAPDRSRSTITSAWLIRSNRPLNV
jgi:hypothetical protein